MDLHISSATKKDKTASQHWINLFVTLKITSKVTLSIPLNDLFKGCLFYSRMQDFYSREPSLPHHLNPPHVNFKCGHHRHESLLILQRSLFACRRRKLYWQSPKFNCENACKKTQVRYCASNLLKLKLSQEKVIWWKVKPELKVDRSIVARLCRKRSQIRLKLFQSK